MPDYLHLCLEKVASRSWSLIGRRFIRKLLGSPSSQQAAPHQKTTVSFSIKCVILSVAVSPRAGIFAILRRGRCWGFSPQFAASLSSLTQQQDEQVNELGWGSFLGGQDPGQGSSEVVLLLG
jgi:hypothetical protein